MTGTLSTAMWCAAMAMACRPDEQKRLMVAPPTVTGRPARMAPMRATSLPVEPSGRAQPISTSSISLGSILERSTACWMAWPAKVAPWVMFRPPRQDLARGVRAVDTMTTSLDITILLRSKRLFIDKGQAPRGYWWTGYLASKPLPSSARLASRAAGSQKPGWVWRSLVKACMARTTLGSPTSSA